MKKMVLIACSFLLVFALAAPVFAKEKLKVIQRTVKWSQSMQPQSPMTVKYRNDTIIITSPITTLVKMQRERKAISDIKMGDRVTVWFLRRDKNRKEHRHQTRQTRSRTSKEIICNFTGAAESGSAVF